MRGWGTHRHPSGRTHCDWTWNNHLTTQYVISLRHSVGVMMSAILDVCLPVAAGCADETVVMSGSNLILTTPHFVVHFVNLVFTICRHYVSGSFDENEHSFMNTGLMKLAYRCMCCHVFLLLGVLSWLQTTLCQSLDIHPYSWLCDL